MTKELDRYINNEVDVNKERLIADLSITLSDLTEDAVRIKPETAKVTFKNSILDIEMEKVKE